MPPFRMQERDLDLIILEELHADTGFATWLAERIGLPGASFVSGSHSVSAKADAKWGETDVLAVFDHSGERVAVLIENKIAAAFQERQACRYHERAKEIVISGQSSRYITLLVAPSNYLQAVPIDEPWDRRLPIEAIHDWFAHANTSHSHWRKSALEECLLKTKVQHAQNREDVVKFSTELSAYLAIRHAPTLTHKPGADPTGPVIHCLGYRPKDAMLWWKVNRRFMTLQISDPLRGVVGTLELPEEVLFEKMPRTDNLNIAVPDFDFSAPFDEQIEVVEKAISAAYRLIAILPSIAERIAIR